MDPTINLALSMARLESSRAPGSRPLPGFIQIEPVGHCNLDCPMCAVRRRPERKRRSPDNPAFLDFALFRQLIDETPGLEQVQLQGLGEPLLHPRFLEMVSYAHERGIRVHSSTNLQPLRRDMAWAIAAGGLEYLQLSCDGATASTYESIRVGGSFARFKRNLEMLVRARQQAGSGPRLSLVAVAMKRNLHQLPELVSLAASHALDEVFIQHLSQSYDEDSLAGRYLPLRSFWQQENLLSEDPERVRHYFHETQRRAARLGMALRMPALARAFDGAFPAAEAATEGRGATSPCACTWLSSGIYVTFDGYAMPCGMASTPDRVNFGTVDAPGRLAAVWNGGHRAFARQLESGTPPAICRSCSVYRGTF